MKNNGFTIFIFLLTFILSALFSFVAIMLSDINVILLCVILLIVILIGIVADMAGVAVLSGDEARFHAMASQKIKGSKEAVKLIRNNAHVSSICNDVIGDICGILSGALGASLAAYIISKKLIADIFVSVLMGALISTLTVGLKAVAKKVAIAEANKIIFIIGKVQHFFKPKGK